ncbi:GAF and ANTAR domain-containing protein [Streptomyces sp. ID05-04B]|uniref:GAF and ANTAR domain-containing protein n=1 Tax=unclassified Streptomyces TaxID=2593676 RepID=UPI000D19C9C8|nr:MULTISPECIES: GAF and ANTAR domain-containing protein [unclassified Streptomyces]AVV46531.1 antitermination regulator [Streptomyces sp. P3]MDX5565703.1 GAF and ANTAR domain-containing protein [Streptomyces sp. ID05-04B]
MTVQWREYAEQMALLARDLLAQESVEATLNEIAASAVRLVEGCDAAGILAVRKGRAVTLAACGDMVHECDRLQAEYGEGPCFDLARRKDGARLYRIADMHEPQPAWQRFAAAARTLGVGSMTGVLLYTDNDDFGALNLYGRRPGAFSKDIETAGWLLASHAAVALDSARTIDQLEHAMETRHAIGEAIGILRERHKLSEEDAFNVLRRISQHHNVKLRDVAQRVRTDRTDSA